MKTEKLTSENVNQYLDYLKKAFSEEPEQMTAEQIDEAGIRNRVGLSSDPDTRPF